MNHFSRKAGGAPLSLLVIASIAAVAAGAAVPGGQTPSQAAVASKGKPASEASYPSRPAAQDTSADGPDAPMTRAQGAAILNELRAIQLLIQNGGLANTTRRAAPPVRDVVVPISPGWRTLGRADAPVTVIEFTDLQCPFCRQLERTTFPELEKEYVDTGKVRFVSLDLPLTMHAYALGAAEAEQCAAQLGKFWEFRNAVLDDQAPPTPGVLLGHASQLGLNKGVFKKCLESKGGDAAVQAGTSVATALGVRGTPGFVVGRVAGGAIRGVVFTGARPISFFEQYINAALNQSPPASMEPGHNAGQPGAPSRGDMSGTSGSR